MEQSTVAHEPVTDATTLRQGEPTRGAETPGLDVEQEPEPEPFDPGRVTMRFREGRGALLDMPAAVETRPDRRPLGWDRP